MLHDILLKKEQMLYRSVFRHCYMSTCLALPSRSASSEVRDRTGVGNYLSQMQLYLKVWLQMQLQLLDMLLDEAVVEVVLGVVVIVLGVDAVLGVVEDLVIHEQLAVKYKSR